MPESRRERFNRAIVDRSERIGLAHGGVFSIRVSRFSSHPCPAFRVPLLVAPAFRIFHRRVPCFPGLRLVASAEAVDSEVVEIRGDAGDVAL